MDYRQYYGDPFRRDLAGVVRGLPGHHGAWEDGGAILQPFILSNENPAIACMGHDQRSLFATALFFTVLVDQVAYTYYKPHYSAFRVLTLYPKLVGNCLGACHYHFHPRSVFSYLATVRGPVYKWDQDGLFDESSVEVMRAEVLDFFRVHLPAVDGAEFWEFCLAELPR